MAATLTFPSDAVIPPANAVSEHPPCDGALSRTTTAVTIADKPATGSNLTDTVTAQAEHNDSAPTHQPTVEVIDPPTVQAVPDVAAGSAAVEHAPMAEAGTIPTEAAPAEVVAPAEIAAPAEDTAPIAAATVGDDLFPVEAALAEMVATVDAPAPIEVAAPAEDPAPVEAAAPGDDLPLFETSAPGAEPAPAAGEMPAVAEKSRPIFADLGLSESVLRAIDDMGYRHPTPIQEQAIPSVLMGRDVMGVAQTGTGKTAGFTLPMLDILTGSRARARMPRSLILEPTRELALQVAENFVQYGKYLKLTHALIIGGESMSDQKDVLNRGVDVLIATPGRLIDMFERGSILLSDAKLLVIDEADRMLDMGFIPDVERIVSLLPRTRQTLFFSATMGPEIRRLADAFLQDPREITVSRSASVATTITEGLVLVAETDKREALRHLVRTQNVQNALIFCNRKKDVDILYKSLTRHRFSVGALHGDMAQTVRFATLEKFKAGDLRLLVCSDVAARGLDIGGLSHVFNFDVPIHAEDYVHRIGRTGRAGLEGQAFTIAQPEDRFHVEAIEKLIRHAIPPINIEGLDPVDWVDDEGRKRRGRTGARKKPEAREKAPRSRAPRERAVVEAVAAEPGPARREAPPREAPPRRETPPREAPLREAPPVEKVASDRPSRDRPRRDAPRRDEPRRDEPRRDEPRRDEPRRDEPRRERYRRDDDLGPAVTGFGDDVPAFMLLRPRTRRVAGDRETEA